MGRVEVSMRSAREVYEKRMRTEEGAGGGGGDF
jgi:hypothetical protein